MDDGLRLLKRVMAKQKLDENAVAARVGCTPPLVYHWLARRRLPGYRTALALLREFGIPYESWSRARVRRGSYGSKAPGRAAT